MLEIDKRFGKYANPEVERRFLIKDIPSGSELYSEITDYYVIDTTLRLRNDKREKETLYKLSQKLRVDPESTRMIMHTNLYLTESEFNMFTALPFNQLSKKRYKLDSDGTLAWVDVFEGVLNGLVIMEVDFGPDGDPEAFVVPSFVVREVTDDERFTGGNLASTTENNLKGILEEFEK